MKAVSETASTPRGQRADAKQNRAKLLEAAQALFAARGASVPIDEIAQRAGVGPGTLYRHFPNKEALFKAVVLERLQRLVEEARNLAQGADAGVAFFSFLRNVVEEGVVKRDLVDALAEMGYDLKAQIAGEMKEAFAAMELLLTRAQVAGAVRGEATVADVFALVTAIIRASDAKRSGQRSRLFAIVTDGLRR